MMGPFKVNFKGSFKDLKCDKCHKHEDSLKESFNCEEVFKDQPPKTKYEDLFNEDITKDSIEDLEKILHARPNELKDL